jgi:hypothetical protein
MVSRRLPADKRIISGEPMTAFPVLRSGPPEILDADASAPKAEGKARST